MISKNERMNGKYILCGFKALAWRKSTRRLRKSLNTTHWLLLIPIKIKKKD